MTNDTNRVIAAKELSTFFHKEVLDAKNLLGISMSDASEYYLVNLLCDFARAETSPSLGDEPLALMYKRALESDTSTRMQVLKSLGDISLYVSGFFVESIERSLVDIDYYIAMGGGAYFDVSGLVGLHAQSPQFAKLYEELAKKFAEFVELLHEIADHARKQVQSNQVLLRLYDRWLRTRTERTRNLLVEKGLLPVDGLSTVYEQ